MHNRLAAVFLAVGVTVFLVRYRPSAYSRVSHIAGDGLLLFLFFWLVLGVLGALFGPFAKQVFSRRNLAALSVVASVVMVSYYLRGYALLLFTLGFHLLALGILLSGIAGPARAKQRSSRSEEGADAAVDEGVADDGLARPKESEMVPAKRYSHTLRDPRVTDERNKIVRWWDNIILGYFIDAEHTLAAKMVAWFKTFNEGKEEQIKSKRLDAEAGRVTVEEETKDIDADTKKTQADTKKIVAERKLEEARNPPPTPEPKKPPTKEELRGRVESEIHAVKLDIAEKVAKAGTEDEQKRWQNIGAAKLRQLQKEWEKYL